MFVQLDRSQFVCGLGIEVRGYKSKLGVLGYRLKVMCGVGIAIRGLNKVFVRI